ncbi:MAG: hypothetical protein H0X62_16850, partial [Bacteroidetes bacterium]|nr:hypothetical protein [Bacteroidota bacterium]
MKRIKQLLAFLCTLLAGLSFAQTGNNLREKIFVAESDTIQLDSLSSINGSEILFLADGSIADTSFYTLDYFSSQLILKQPYPDTLRIIYRVFPHNFRQVMLKKDIRMIEPDGTGRVNPFAYVYDPSSGSDIFMLEGLTKNGSISRGITFGNNQDLAVNSNMNMQLAGKINENVSILAAITDHNIPIQPDGNTHQLQDFDQVYIQLFDDKTKLTAGDFQLTRPNSYFMNYFKRAQGGHFTTAVDVGKDKQAVNTVSAAAAVSRGKFSRNIIQGIEGVQGPYRLKGVENETFIIVLSGTETVFIDGMLLKRGQEYDYVIDYNTAEVIFTANTLITKDKRIVVEFQYSDRNYARSLFHVGNEFQSDRLKANFNYYGEQDAKNQPLLQDLGPEQQELMALVGDSIHQAIYPNVTVAEGFNANQIQYVLSDTVANGISYDSIYVYTNNPNLGTYYDVGFSQVGENRGNYSQVRSTANGKVFEWVAPVNGVPQGSFEPITLLVTPKKRQMATFGGEYKISKTTIASMEMAVSNNDINTFSNLDNENNSDIAFRLGILNEQPLKAGNSSDWVLSTKANYEQTNQNFTPIERFRSIEFERDWNIQNQVFTESQHISSFGAGVSKAGVG